MERTVADAYEQQQSATNHTPPKTTMTMKNPPFADVFPIVLWGIFQPVMLVNSAVWF